MNTFHLDFKVSDQRVPFFFPATREVASYDPRARTRHRGKRKKGTKVNLIRKKTLKEKWTSADIIDGCANMTARASLPPGVGNGRGKCIEPQCQS